MFIRITDRIAAVPGNLKIPHEFERFYHQQMPQLVRFLAKLGATWEEAEDTAQETFVRLLVSWQDVASPNTWLRIVASRLWKQTRSRDRQATLLAIRGDWAPRPIIVDMHLDDEEKHVYLAISQLPPRQREVFAWYYDGYQPTQIAELLKLSAADVRANLYHARKRLKQLLGSGEGGTHGH